MLLEEVSASNGGSGIYCDTLSVSQYDSKVRSGLADGFKRRLARVVARDRTRQSLNNLFSRLCSCACLIVYDEVVGATQHGGSVSFGGLGCCAVSHQQLIVPKNFKKLPSVSARGAQSAPRVGGLVRLTCDGHTTCCLRATSSVTVFAINMFQSSIVVLATRLNFFSNVLKNFGVVDYRHRVPC